MSHFTVSLIVWAKSQDSVHKPQFLRERRAEADRTEVLLLTSLAPYRWATPAHSFDRRLANQLIAVRPAGCVAENCYLPYRQSLLTEVGCSNESKSLRHFETKSRVLFLTRMKNVNPCNGQCWAGLVSTYDQNFNTIFSNTINVINVKLCLMVVFIELYPFIPLSVTLIVFHSSFKQF